MLTVVILTLFLLIAGCASNEINPTANSPVDEHGRRDTPVRIGSVGPTYVMYAEKLTLISAIEKSDIIADITIIEWLGENDSNTFFLAKVNKILKGEHFEEIEVIQMGDSKNTLKDFPLFKNGDRLLAFLDNARDYHEDKYWVCITSFLDISEYEGEPYLISRGADFDEEIFENGDIQKIDGRLRRTVNEAFIRHDPLLAEIRGTIFEKNRDVFDYNDVVKIVSGIVRDGERQ